MKSSEEPKPEQAISPEPEAVQENPTEVAQEAPNPKEDPPLMFSSLPRLALLEEVRTTGNVVFVSPEARIWFSPLWAQEKLEEVSQVRNILSSRENDWTFEKWFHTFLVVIFIFIRSARKFELKL